MSCYEETWPERFDALFGLTHGIKSWDYWMQDNEVWEHGDELDVNVKKLAKARRWAFFLETSDECYLGRTSDKTLLRPQTTIFTAFKLAYFPSFTSAHRRGSNTHARAESVGLCAKACC